jgi:hypothetical protein
MSDEEGRAPGVSGISFAFHLQIVFYSPDTCPSPCPCPHCHVPLSSSSLPPRPSPPVPTANPEQIEKGI